MKNKVPESLAIETGFSRESGLAGLVYAMLLGVVVTIILAGLYLSQTETQVRQQTQFGVVQMGMQGAQVFAACLNETGTGTYTASELIPGMPDTTPWGNGWVCEKMTGGLNGGLITLVMYNEAPQVMPGVGNQVGTMIQNNMAWNVAGVAFNQVGTTNNNEVAVLPAGSSQAQLISPSGNTMTLPGSALNYATPVLINGLVAN
ncbi:MAG: hypothetical protein PHX24_02075 [Acidithiobacillus sp.]|nr:hypothetical protein [Acidithiobacillus sp.]